MEKKKILAVSSIFLFIGVAVAPSINSSVVKSSDDLVEVTSQACGIQGFGNTTVKLTKQQYHDLEQYLVDFRAKLNQTTTREEAVPIFKDAVVELNKYGLLPRGMSVEQALNFILRRYVSPKGSRLLERTTHQNHLPQNEVDNLLCLVAGNTNNNIIIGPIKSSLFIALLLLIDRVQSIELWFYDHLPLKLLLALFTVVDDFLFFLSEPVRVIPAEILGLVTFGDIDTVYYPYTYHPSIGWIYSAGLKGIQSLNGSFHGTIGETPIIWEVIYFGLSAFTGIVLRPWGTGQLVFLGSAFRAGLSTTPP